MKRSRAQKVSSLFSQEEQYSYSPHYYSHGGEYPPQHYYQREVPEQNHEYEQYTPEELKQLEYELRRKNPDLLDKLRFAMSDRQYGVLLGQLAKGAFYGAAIIGAPYIVPLLAAGAITHSRAKQIERRDMGIKPRYHLRPGDSY